MSQVGFVRSVGLSDIATGDQTGTVGEPTAASVFQEVFVTGNWFASRSGDGGATWSFVDPFTTLPSTAGGFCCDQVVLHERSRNLWIWILQYSQAAGSNAFRLAVSTSGAPNGWTYWDFKPGDLDAAWSTNAWFDYPDAATSANHLYITFNMFDSANNWLRAVVLKMPLTGLVSGNLTYVFYTITSHGSLRLARGASTEMYFASHHGQNPIRVFKWPDAAAGTLSSFDVNASPWSGAGQYTSPGPGGVEWLSRVDPRITAGWTVGGRAGFMWTANADGGHPQPYVKAIEVDIAQGSVVSQPDIWSTTQAWAYPAACPNTDGVLGVSLFFGGGGISHPAHVVGFLESGQWILATSRVSTHGPADAKWGDYLSCGAKDPDARQWVASGYTLQGGSDRLSIEPQYVHFEVRP